MATEATWRILGIPDGGDRTLEGARRAYRSAALKLHPDKGGNTADFQALAAAYGEVAAAAPDGCEEKAQRRTFKCPSFVHAITSVGSGRAVVAVGDAGSVSWCGVWHRSPDWPITQSLRGCRDITVLACCVLDGMDSVAVGCNDGWVHLIGAEQNLDDGSSPQWRHPDRLRIVALAATVKVLAVAAGESPVLHTIGLNATTATLDLLQTISLPSDSAPEALVFHGSALGAEDMAYLAVAGSDSNGSGFVASWIIGLTSSSTEPESDPLWPGWSSDSDDGDSDNDAEVRPHGRDSGFNHDLRWTITPIEPVFAVAATDRLLAWISGPKCSVVDAMTGDVQWSQRSEGAELRDVAMAPNGLLLVRFFP